MVYIYQYLDLIHSTLYLRLSYYLYEQVKLPFIYKEKIYYINTYRHNPVKTIITLLHLTHPQQSTDLCIIQIQSNINNT